MSDERMTIPEYAAWCRENCPHPAQGFDDGRPCGNETENEEGEMVRNFCGYHWGPLI